MNNGYKPDLDIGCVGGCAPTLRSCKNICRRSQSIAAKAHGVVIMPLSDHLPVTDRAGWHKSGALKIPKNLSIDFRGKSSTGRLSFPSNLPPY
jgi:hypothetical protein